jgi:hypothetical protein
MSKRPGQWGHQWEAGPLGPGGGQPPATAASRCTWSCGAGALDALIVYSSPMTENCRETSGCHRSRQPLSPVVAQGKTGWVRPYRDLRVGNRLVAGSSPAHPTSVTRENLPRLASSFLLRRGMAGGGDLPERMTGRSSRDVTAHGASPVHGLHDIDRSRAGLGLRKNDTHLRRMPDDID